MCMHYTLNFEWEAGPQLTAGLLLCFLYADAAADAQLHSKPAVHTHVCDGLSVQVRTI